MSKLSVIIPVYQAEKYLEQAVASVLSQNWQGETEIIIVDDGSTDGSLSIARKLGDTVLSQNRCGAASARNSGIKASTGEWILLLDADDVLTEDALMRLYEPFVNQPELAVVFGRAVDFVSPELSDEEKRPLSIRSGSYGGVLPGCALLRRSVFDEIGLFDQSLNSGETVAWQLKLRDAKVLTACVEFVTLRRRIHLTNTGRISAEQEKKNYASILRERMKNR